MSALPESKGNSGWVFWILLKILEFRTKTCWKWSSVHGRGWNFPFWKFLNIPEAGVLTSSMDSMSSMNVLLTNALFV